MKENEGIEHKVNDAELDTDKEVEQVREAVPFLKTLTPGALGKYIRKRWDRMNKQARIIQNELRVNFLRYEGQPFAQIHPNDENRVFIPNHAKTKLPPSVNKIRRTVHRYVAQTTADEPILEGVPANHDDESRDAAEAATLMLRGEWDRMELNGKLERVGEVGAVMRSGFWFFEWDEHEAGKVPAQKYFENPDTGQPELWYVDGSGNKVSDPKDAKEIWQGNVTCEVLFPFNVRWSGARKLKKADEVFVAKLITLGQLYDMFPKTRNVKLSELIGHTTREFEEWYHEIRGASGIAGRNTAFTEDELGETGRSMTEIDSKLDEPIMLINYYKKPSGAYPKGFHGMIAGKHLVYDDHLRYGLYPIAQFKCLDSLRDPLGLSLVDILKDPQELLNFVNGQVLRFLQAMKRRWFVPLNSGVNAGDLMNNTKSYIPFNAQAGPPVPEQVPNVPSSMTDWVERFDQAYDDEAGIHDTMQGKHVPGVSSGRHAEALRSGDETILGLTRTQIKRGLEDAGEIILAMVKKEWKMERRVRFFDNRTYVEKAFTRTDFRNTSKVQLRKGTLLMLTQAQKLETMFAYVEMGAMTVEELRRDAPLYDVAGISVTEDPHYQKARRENDLFLSGPTKKLQKERAAYEAAMASVVDSMKTATQAMQLDPTADPEAAQLIMQKLQAEGQAIEEEWDATMRMNAPFVAEWEQQPAISGLHLTEHSKVLASEKVSRLPLWWVEYFTQHAMQHFQMVAAAQQTAEEEPQAEEQMPQ